VALGRHPPHPLPRPLQARGVTIAATIRLLADAVAARIAAGWTPTAPNAVTRVYLPDVEEATRLEGRQVYVAFPLGYGQAETADRAEDSRDYRVDVLVAECFRGAAGPPPRDWLDERIDFVDGLWRDLGQARAALFAAPFENAYPVRAEVTTAFDPESLREEKLFWSLLELTYRRDE